MARGAAAVALVAAALAVARPAAADRWGESYSLPNGLRVVLCPESRYAFVTVLVRYRAGVTSEPAGRSGIAHLVANLVLGVSRPAPRNFVAASALTYSSEKAESGFDETDYYTTATRGSVRYALWVERWRMGLDIDQVGDIERTRRLEVVKNRRRDLLEVGPYLEGDRLVWQRLFPAGHPFHQQLLGSVDELDAISLDDARGFFRTWYQPGNAALVVVGDFDPSEARRTVQDYFAALPSRAVPPLRQATAPALAREEVIEHRERFGKVRRLDVAWHSPAQLTADDAVAEVTAEILGGLHDSRLARALPDASASRARQESYRSGSVFQIQIDARPGAALPGVRRRVDLALDLLAQRPPAPEEVERAVRSILRRMVLRLEDSLEKAKALATLASAGLALDATDPVVYLQDRYRAVTAEQVQSFVRRFLRADNRVVLDSTPLGGS